MKEIWKKYKREREKESKLKMESEKAWGDSAIKTKRTVWL